MPVIELRAPTSFLFFAATVFLAYKTTETRELVWFAYAAFHFFVVLGPMWWIAQAFMQGEGNGLVPVEVPKEQRSRLLRRAWHFQGLLVVSGAAMIGNGLVQVAIPHSARVNSSGLTRSHSPTFVSSASSAARYPSLCLA